ncbi:zinc ribbon domain-containing protein [Bifidobacterium scaligerum]|uniref:Zinc-ribbon domain-containing protein n=1 Tax=Bifidobacterium scaligerum TaxID=2052656 RepID=A0A2M9HS66_9BIFI|nr:zinc-ribbon domain-containing protein [Bifidobacterium scaligerum]PJM79648.1 hypothetical protein CUU80_00360 [Bifidobacterium scaligerum]
MRFCTNCGAQLGESDRFCIQCGQEQEPAQPGTTVPAVGAGVPVPTGVPNGAAVSGGVPGAAAMPEPASDSDATMVDPSAALPTAPGVPMPAQYAAAPTYPAPQPAQTMGAAPVPPSAAAGTYPSSSGKAEGKGKKGRIAAIIVAVVAVLAIVGGLLWFFVIRPHMEGSASSQNGSSQSAGASDGSKSDDKNATKSEKGKKDSKQAKACDKAPDFTISSHAVHGTDLVIKLEATASCGADSTLNLDGSAVRLTLTDNDKATFADAVYDFSDDPVTADAGESANVSVAFVQGQYWLVPDQVSWDDLSVTCDLKGTAQGKAATPSKSDDFTGADALDKDGREQVAKAAIDRQIEHDKDAVSDIASTYTTQLSSKQLNMQVDGKTWTYQDIWQQFVDLKNQWPSTLFVWSGDWGNYQRSGTTDYYVILSGESFSDRDEGWDWCSDNGFGQNDCMPVTVG